jgi:hypothetical protein
MHTVVDVCELSCEEQELLRAAAANQGELQVVVRADTRGQAVCAGRKKFYDPADRSVAQRHVSLVVRLKEFRLLRGAAMRNSYELTNFGWQLSRKLGRPMRQSPRTIGRSAYYSESGAMLAEATIRSIELSAGSQEDANVDESIGSMSDRNPLHVM